MAGARNSVAQRGGTGLHWARSKRRGVGRTPAVIVGGRGPGALGMIRSLNRASVPVILLEEDALAPAMHTRYARKVAISQASGQQLMEALLALASDIDDPAVLFLSSDDAVLTVSEHRSELQGKYRFLMPSHHCLASLIHKSSFRELAEASGFPVPRSVAIQSRADLDRLPELRFPCIVKPTRATPEYQNQGLARGYKVAIPEEAEAVCRRLLLILPDLVIQEWIEGADHDLYFCLQYRLPEGGAACSFVGRKLVIWPPDVGVTASCTAAPEAEAPLRALTDQFFEQVGFVGMGGIEFKRDARTGEFLMIEPTVGRSDGQVEVATLHGVNIPLAAYCHESGLPIPRSQLACSPLIWREFVSCWMAARDKHSPVMLASTKVYDAYWRLDDPLPGLFRLLGGSARFLRKRSMLALGSGGPSGPASSKVAAATGRRSVAE
jgi:D-aspartate ligase